MIKDIMASNNRHDHFQRLCDSIFAISPNIRFVGVIDKMGRTVALELADKVMRVNGIAPVAYSDNMRFIIRRFQISVTSTKHT